ncbi:MAG: hypothetical protein NC092_07825 [Butyrivibrio sp.]|nr:hypothetical protein [Butyrivibrio sp.]
MFRKIKSIVAIVMVGTLLLGQSSGSFAKEEVTDNLVPYEEKLTLLNNELGTDYVLFPTENTTYDEMVAFYTAMSLAEFEEYIRNAYEAEQEFDEIMEQETTMKKDPIEACSTLDTQRYYYAANANYLYLKAYTTTVSGSTVYTGDINSAGYSISSYPAYRATSCSESFASDKKTVDITYSCVKCVSENLIYTTIYTIKVTYEAGAGDIYPVI